jgi:Brp/Blh family beta-carotene 15,15'-monooxygenase
MSWPFSWQALTPPGDSRPPNWLQTIALAGLLAVLAGGALQSGLDLDENWWALLPLVASALLFGLPHGAIDHLVVIGLARRQLTLSTLLAVLGIYLGIMLGYGLLWWIAPFLSLGLFLLITIVHWGKADTAFDQIRYPESPALASKGFRWSHSALRGLIPIGMPMLAFPDATAEFLLSCSRLFSNDPMPSISPVQILVAAALALCFIAEIVFLLKHQPARGSMAMLAESLSLVALFALVQPLVAVGWYFCLWHGLRHVLRLSRYQPGFAEATRSFMLFFKRALPFTLVALVMLFLFSTGLPSSEEAGRWIALYLVVISTLTLPHMLVVEWMDRVELGMRARP